MPLNPVTGSSTVTGESYDPTRNVLTLRYKNNFHYEYQNVEPEKYKAFQEAESKGAWLNANMRGKDIAEKHPFTKIEPPPETEE